MTDPRWDPWTLAKTNEIEPELPEITEPPCKECRWFAPRRWYQDLAGRLATSPAKPEEAFVGVRMCHAPMMHFDFSCFSGRLTTESSDRS